jgi:hypothetical protein
VHQETLGQQLVALSRQEGQAQHVFAEGVVEGVDQAQAGQEVARVGLLVAQDLLVEVGLQLVGRQAHRRGPPAGGFEQARQRGRIQLGA